jgi:hypothetical protein
MDQGSQDRPALTDVEITPAMIEAGADAYWAVDVEDVGSEKLVQLIYLAMFSASLVE